MNNERFIEEVFEIAFGDNAINRDYSKQEVINKLKDFSDTSLLVQELEERVDTSNYTEMYNELQCINEYISKCPATNISDIDNILDDGDVYVVTVSMAIDKEDLEALNKKDNLENGEYSERKHTRKILGFIKDIPEKEVNKLEKTI